MFSHQSLKTWKWLSFTLPFVLLFPAITVAYGERTALSSPSEETEQKALSIKMESAASDSQEVVGTIRITQRATGVVIEPALKGLTPGLHGLHLHEGDSCQPGPSEDTESANSPEPAKEAGDHWDPGLTGNHAGPWEHGHRGDLPNLYVNPDGEAITPVYAPRVTSQDFENRALVLHARRDNYSDEPDSSGGSGKAVACGVNGD